MKTKKLITVAVAFILACAGLSACGNTNGTSNGASTQSQKAETPKPADLTGKLGVTTTIKMSKQQ